jgi:hypothetical protein
MQSIRREAEEVQRLRRELDAASVRLESTRSDLERKSAETAELRGQLSRLSTLASLLLRHVDPAHADEFSRAFADISLHVGDSQILDEGSIPLRKSALGGSFGSSGSGEGRYGPDAMAAASAAAAQTVRSALLAQSPGKVEQPEVFSARAPSKVELQSALELALQRADPHDRDSEPDPDSAYAAAYFSAAAARSSGGEEEEEDEEENEEKYLRHRDDDALRRAEFYAALQLQEQPPAAFASAMHQSAPGCPADIWDTAHAAAAVLPGVAFGGESTAAAGAGAGYDLDMLLSRLELLSTLEGAPAAASGAAMSKAEQRGDPPHKAGSHFAEADTLRL